MSLGLLGVESYEFIVRDLERSRRFYVDKMDFREVARTTPEHESKRGERGSVFRAGKVRVEVVTPVDSKGRAGKYLAWHPDGVATVTFAVRDIEAAHAYLAGRHATFMDTVQTATDAAGGTYKHFAIATALGDVVFRYIERRGYQAHAPGWQDLAVADEGNRFGIAAVDHITVNMLSLEPWVSWCRDVLGMEQFWEVEFHTEDVRTEKGLPGSGLFSIVMKSPEAPVKFAANEPRQPFFHNSQITKFVEDHRGAGIQHVAFILPEIIPTVDELKRRGVGFLKTPGIYYQMLPERLKTVDVPMEAITQPMSELQRLGILVDGADGRYMLQIFMQEGALMYGEAAAGPFFYEIIQRCGDPGFGAGNFRALFEAIERDQQSRG